MGGFLISAKRQETVYKPKASSSGPSHVRKIIVIGDPFYSSLAHLTRVIRLFELIKQTGIPDVETHLFAYEGEIVGHQIAILVAAAVKSRIIDKIIPIHPLGDGSFFDLNKAKTLVSYIKGSKSVLLNELSQKGRYISEVAQMSDVVMVVHSPGYLGPWYAPPFVPVNVQNILILDTVFHPKCDIHFGTTWKASSLNGRFQGLLLKAGFYQPFLRAVNEIRGEFGLSFCPTRDVLYKDHPIIDPNVPSYMRLSQAVDNYWQVGPLLISRNSDSDEPGELIDFKGDNKLVYLTLGGSAKSHLFIEFINDIVLRLVNFTGGKVKFVITTGLVVDPEDVYKRLGENSTSCLVRNYYDAQVVTSVADVAVGVMGHGHILSAVKNGCPVVVCPVNADQVTHGNLVSRLNLGESPLRISFSEMFTSDVLVKKILSSTELLAATVMRVLENSLRYGNPQLMCELNEYSEDMQLDAVRKLLIRSPG